MLTGAGSELLQRARSITSAADTTWASVRRLDDNPRGLLRVSVFGASDVDLFTSFIRDFPEVQLEIHASTSHVDLIRDGIDVAIRYGKVTDPEAIARRVCTTRTLVVASPSYIEQYGLPTDAMALETHDCIRTFTSDGHPKNEWPIRGGGTVKVRGRLVGNVLPVIHAAVLAGHGLALLPENVVRADLKSGRLVPVLEDSVGSEAPVSVVYADREFIDAKVRVFVDRAVASLRATFADPGVVSP
jgi:DNA-binding transcriptional LysR family regulator